LTENHITKFKSFDMKTQRLIVALIFIGSLSVRCVEDIPDCPSQMCVLSGSWRLTTVYYDDERVADDFSLFRLTLTEPQPTTNETSDFSRIQVSGEPDTGTWSIQNNGSVLRLVPGDIPDLTEDWMIERYSPRELVLVIQRDTGIKEGPATIRLLLEPIE
jgi:hypothetical protein